MCVLDHYGNWILPSEIVSGRPQAQQQRIPCPNCHRTYSTIELLKRHLKFECGVEPQFECPICHRRTRHKHNLTAHLKTHFRGDRSAASIPQQPGVGGGQDDSWADPEWYNFLVDEYYYFCVYVADLLVDHLNWSVHNGSVDNHHLHHDPDPGPGRHSCPRCGRQYKWKQTLLRHTKYECGVEPQFICPICRAPFHHRNVLQRHMNLHSRPKWCQKTFWSFSFVSKLQFFLLKKVSTRICCVAKLSTLVTILNLINFNLDFS